MAAAAEYYYQKPVEELTLAENATLVGLLPAPNRYKPTRNPHLAKQQRNIVLLRMADEAMYWAKRTGRRVGTIQDARPAVPRPCRP